MNIHEWGGTPCRKGGPQESRGPPGEIGKAALPFRRPPDVGPQSDGRGGGLGEKAGSKCRYSETDHSGTATIGLAGAGVSLHALKALGYEADSDDEFLQDLWRTPARSSKVPHDDGGDWLADLLTTPPPEQARPASPPRGSGELASEEELHMLFSASVAECKGLLVEHWNFDEGKVHHPLHDLVDGAAFYIGATVNPRRRFLGGQSRGGSMPGHCLSWDRLTVLHLANGIGARRVETNLISYCKGRYGHLCTNTAMDSRGVSAQEPAFVYVCTGQRQTPRPPRLRATPERGGARGC